MSTRSQPESHHTRDLRPDCPIFHESTSHAQEGLFVHNKIDVLVTSILSNRSALLGVILTSELNAKLN